MKLEALARRENFSTFNALEGCYRRPLIQMDLSFMHHHVAVSRESFIAYIALIVLDSCMS